MVLLLLEIKAELESITNLVPKGGSDGSEYTFFFKVISFGSVLISGLCSWTLQSSLVGCLPFESCVLE
jgi:hypothetical protein